MIVFYRQELDRRYAPSNLKRYPAFAGATDADLEAFHRFLLDYVYPPIEARQRLDMAIHATTDTLRSPKKLAPLMRAGLTSLWRLGSQVPAAVAAGQRVLDGFKEIRKLEVLMCQQATLQQYTLADLNDRHRLLQLVTSLPEEEIQRLTRDLIALVRALSNVSLLGAAVKFMDVAHGVLQKRTDLYTQQDREAFQLGLEMVRAGVALFERMSKLGVENIVAGVEQIEGDWYQEARAEAVR